MQVDTWYLKNRWPATERPEITILFVASKQQRPDYSTTKDAAVFFPLVTSSICTFHAPCLSLRARGMMPLAFPASAVMLRLYASDSSPSGSNTPIRRVWVLGAACDLTAMS